MARPGAGFVLRWLGFREVEVRLAGLGGDARHTWVVCQRGSETYSSVNALLSGPLLALFSLAQAVSLGPLRCFGDLADRLCRRRGILELACVYGSIPTRDAHSLPY